MIYMTTRSTNSRKAISMLTNNFPVCVLLVPMLFGYIYTYVCMYVCMYVCIYIYIFNPNVPLFQVKFLRYIMGARRGLWVGGL